jgi:prepilin-type N-terminal cleavage/methylation domain-containing protein
MMSVARHRFRRTQGAIRRLGTGTKGFTLVELIVAMTVSLIVIGITTALLLSGTSMTQHTTQRALEEQVIDGVFNYAEKQLRFAGAVEGLYSEEINSVPAEGTALYVGNGAGVPSERGMLFSKKGADPSDPSTPLNVLGDSFYFEHTVSLESTLTYRLGKKPVVSLKVALYNAAGTKVSERERSITLINGAVGTEDSTTVPLTNIVSPDGLLYFASTAATSP